MKQIGYFIWGFCALFLAACGNEDEPQFPVEQLTLGSSKLFLPMGEEAVLQVTVSPEGADQTVQWSSADASVVQVDASGVIHPVKVGSTSVIARSGGQQATCEVHVVHAVQRTVLVYMAADNNLGDYNGTVHFAQNDWEEMKLGMQQVAGRGSRLLVYKDFRRGLQKPVLMELIRADDGSMREEVIKTYEERNSVGVAEMQEVFGDVFANPKFRASSYGLVYWSHGDGWIPFPAPNTRWVGEDTGQGTHRMNISELVQVLDYIPNLRFDFILFDACFMQSVEVAYALRPFADYLIASPTETPGPGAPYDAIVPYMLVGQEVVGTAEAYYQVYEHMYDEGVGISNSNWTGGVSMAVTRLTEMQTLATVTRRCLAEAEAASPEDLRLARLFDYDCRTGRSHVGYYDFLQLMRKVLPDAPFKEWEAAYNQCMAYWKTTPKNYSGFVGMFSMEGSHGVTHYIPASASGATAAAYRQTDWYQASGLSQLGW